MNQPETSVAATEVAERVLGSVSAPVHPWGPSEDAVAQLESAIAELTDDEQVRLLVAAYDAMPRLRDVRDMHRGPLLYAAAGIIGKKKPPIGDAALSHILLSARHDCGHGLDTRLPFDLAMDLLRTQGWSPALGRAIQAYAAGLPTGGTVVQSIRRSADLLVVLDTDVSDLRGARKAWWINRVRVALADIGGEERALWERLVLAMRVGEQMAMPKRWVVEAAPILEALGADTLGDRLSEWWPRPPKESLKGSGAQLLKHLIWSLDIVDHADREPLVATLADIEWTPKQPMAVLKPAAASLSDATSSAGLDALQRLRSAIAG